jgi:rhodanese-related sulfurtransferase
MKTVKAVGLLLAISIITAFTANYFSPVGIALVGQWDTSQGVVSAKAKNDVVFDNLEIDDLTEARKLYDSGKTVFVDARSREDYEEGHIKGAVSLPVGQFNERIEKFLQQYSPETAILTYCSGRTCEDSHRLAQLLLDYGYTTVNVLIDGYPDWKAEGYPIE